MEDKRRVRPELSSPDHSQDVEFTIDRQNDEGQHEQDEKENRGPLGPPNIDKRYKANRQRRDFDELLPKKGKQHRDHVR